LVSAPPRYEHVQYVYVFAPGSRHLDRHFTLSHFDLLTRLRKRGLEHVVIAAGAEHLAEEARGGDFKIGILAQLLHAEHHAVHLLLAQAEADRLVHRRVRQHVLRLVVVRGRGLLGLARLQVHRRARRREELLGGDRHREVLGRHLHGGGLGRDVLRLLRHDGRLEQVHRVVGLLREDFTCVFARATATGGSVVRRGRRVARRRTDARRRGWS
jgi:hypothetical protein